MEKLDPIAIRIHHDDAGWVAIGEVDGEPAIMRLPEGYDPRTDMGMRVVIEFTEKFLGISLEADDLSPLDKKEMGL